MLCETVLQQYMDSILSHPCRKAWNCLAVRDSGELAQGIELSKRLQRAILRCCYIYGMLVPCMLGHGSQPSRMHRACVRACLQHR